ncbi:MAG: hypothetical protein DRJ51_00970 [Thermoprotei archaeon]|nr:MAG: hypothetical protein DRJ51_00970 [Thermoprotei archaeon]RLF02969.1 MAG: hypothetical protein DRJ59_02060 [Thermoprotei archaeon]
MLEKKIKPYILILMLTWLLLASPLTFSAPQEIDYLGINEIDVSAIMKRVEYLSRLGSRITGYPGYFKAVDYIRNVLEKLGYNVELQEFYVTIPYDKGALIKIVETGEIIPAYSLYPNLVALGGAKDLRAEVVYVGKGDLESFRGKDVASKIVLMEFNSDNNWLAALKLGARAVVFLEPITTSRLEALKKVTVTPLSFPRLYVERKYAEKLKEACENGWRIEITTNYTWKKIKAYNLIARIEGSSEPEKTVLITAHIDSISIVPALSPGAEEAISPALLLYIAEKLASANPKPKYSVWLVFLSGHWQGLSGARWFVEEFFFNKNRGIGKTFLPYITLNIDITSGSPELIIYPGGFFYGHRTQGALNLYTDFAASLRKWIKEYAEKFPEDFKFVQSEAFGINRTTGIVTLRPFSQIGYGMTYSQAFILDAEPFGLSRSIAVSFLSFKDPRLRVFTPFDLPGYINVDILRPQISFTLFIVNKILNDITSVHRGSWESISPVRVLVDPVNGGFGYADASIEVLEYDPTVSTLYSPIPYALVVIHKIEWYNNKVGSFGRTEWNIFAKIIEMADENGRVRIVGLAPQEAFTGNIEVYAYKVDKEGKLIYVPDLGPNGAGKFAPAPPHLKPGISIKAVAFRAAGLLITDILMPDQPWALITFNAYRKPVFPVPFTQYGTNPVPVKVEAYLENFVEPRSRAIIVDYENKFALIFVPPNERVMVIASLGGLQRKVIILLNVTEGKEIIGRGVPIGEAGSLTIIPELLFHYVREMLTISRIRYERAVSHGIRDSSIEFMLNRTVLFLKRAEEAFKARDYELAYTYSHVAWSSVIELYERTRVMYVDFTNAVLILMILLAPFSVIIEKLFGKGKGLQRLLSILIISAIGFTVFTILHPGFAIVYSISALGMGVILLVLAIPTVFFLLLNLSKSLGQVRRMRIGAHFLEREVFDLFVSAMGIGVENMRKRPLRTFLTLLTIILIVMSLISLTSVIPLPVLYKKSYAPAVKYNAILIESPYNEPLDPAIIPVIQKIVGDRGVAAPRYWLYPSFDYIYVTLEGGGHATFRAVVGVTVEELSLTLREIGIDPKLFDNERACLIPLIMAETLGISEGDVITFYGFKLKVVGFIPDEKAPFIIKDVNEEAGRPLFYGIRPYDVERMNEERRFDKDFRLSWSEILIVNAKLLQQIPGAFIPSIEIRLKDISREEAISLASEIFTTFNKLNVYLAYEGKGIALSSRYIHEFFGFSFMVIPVVIAGLVLTMTILSNMQERVREMKIYSSLGLAPLHVAGMFLAENLSYAVVGAVAGYIGGIIMARAFNFALATGGMIGMNYSSSSVMVSLGLVVVLVLVASAYPFFKVARLVTPSLERRWKIPTKPRGDVWEIPLPFTFRDPNMVVGLVAFLREFLEAHKVERTGVFTVSDVTSEISLECSTIKAIVWLAPFEQNIRQSVELTFRMSKTEGRYLTLLSTKRISGPYDAWITSNEAFVRELRKQLLTWRLLTPQERSKYIERSHKELR